MLVEVGAAFAIPVRLVGFLPALTQFGLACGITFILPLGDVISARVLLITVIPLQIAALLLVFASGMASVLAVACFSIGVFGITPYILPPYATVHAPAERVGHVTGVLTRGIIVGILLARTAAGVIGTHLGWRAVYSIAAVCMGGVLVVVLRLIQPSPAANSEPVRYGDLLLSLLRLVRTVPALRTAAICQAFSFGSFNVFWLGSSLYLQSPRFGWTPESVGLVALVGAAAASAAPLFGRAADRIGPRITRIAALACMAVAWLLFVVFRQDLVGMTVGLVLLDIGATVTDISNRTILYALDARIRIRLNATYTVAMFGGGAVLSALVGICWSLDGWMALCVLGLCPIVGALVLAVRSEPT